MTTHFRRHFDPFKPPANMFCAEIEEGVAAGRTGPTCPFCGSRNTHSTVERDWSGVLSEDWDCSNCDESGWVLDGRLLYVPEGAADAR